MKVLFGEFFWEYIKSKFLFRYQKLLRANSQCAEEMRDQQIELPQTVEELQFLALQLREDLVSFIN